MAMPMWNLFLYKCSQMLVMERDHWQAGIGLHNESRLTMVKELLDTMREPTRRRISILEQVIDRMGGFVGPEDNPISQGIKRAHRQFIESNPTLAARDLDIVMTGYTSQITLAAGYRVLIDLARLLAYEEVTAMLESNLADVESAAETWHDFLTTLTSALQQEGRKAA